MATVKGKNKKVPKVTIVIPTIREQSIKKFLQLWKKEFLSYPNLDLIIVEDNPTQSFDLSSPLPITHFAWEDIERDLGDVSWIIPRRTDCVRSYGYFKAYERGADIMITLDDDCYPTRRDPYLIQAFIDNLNQKASSSWFNTLTARMEGHTDFYPRGFPYEDRGRKTVLCHGLWNNIPDFDGKTQLKHPQLRMKASKQEPHVVPSGVFYPMCGMNVAVRREIIPAFYFLLMGQNLHGKRWGVDRFGDIWAGLFTKKIIDHLGHAVLSGQPVIHHDRASDPHKNILLERNGVRENELLHKAVAEIRLSKDSYRDCYIELSKQLPSSNQYFEVLKKAMYEWSNLF